MKFDKRGQIGVGKILAIILAVIVLGLIIVGTTTGVFQPMFEKIGEKGDEMLIKIKTEKGLELEEEYSCYSTLKTIKDQEVNWTICEDGEYFNATDGIDGLTIDNKKITKVFYGKNDIIKYYLKDDVKEYKISKSNSEEEYLELIKNKDLLNILYLKNNLTEKGIDKKEFGDYKNLEDYYFFSNKTFPMYLFINYEKKSLVGLSEYAISPNNKINIGIDSDYKYKLDYFSNNLLFLNKNENLISNSYTNKEDLLKVKILENYVIKQSFDSIDISKIKSICNSIILFNNADIEFVIASREMNPNFDLEDQEWNTEVLLYFDLMCDKLLGSMRDITTYNDDLSTLYLENIKNKLIKIGINENFNILNKINIKSENIKEEEKKLDEAVEEFKQITSEEQQRIFSEMQKQFNESRTDDANVEYKINQTINISDYYSECGGWHLENGVNVITYGGNYGNSFGIIYNSLDKFEKRMKNKNTQCERKELFFINKFAIVEYNSTTKIWDLNLSAQIFDSDDLNNLEKEIKRSIELSNLYSYKSLRN